ncbi:hypothetical protein COY23_02000 [bacterium (Candidatus Torokbacteria) CG_4_10_14_0_2_um_filter_35_8]|nr:MAG: hypothetical protein COY23_02000 [bacterium (Candidatus Torokbacteria) CG_4_10_14_0_2_um_filter_35_8]
MADDPNFVPNWNDEATQCKNCKAFQEKEDKKACVPPDMSFEDALAKFGEIPENGHCDFFQAK